MCVGAGYRISIGSIQSERADSSEKSFSGFEQDGPSNAFERGARVACWSPHPFITLEPMTQPASGWPDLGRFWTLPNALSLVRLALVFPIAGLIWLEGSLEWLVGLVLIAILTDWFDGRLARWLNTVSDWGKVLDPLADKVAAVLTVLALTFRPTEPNLPLWFLALVVVRDGAIVAGSAILARRVGKIVMSAWLGKAATTWLAITVLAAILRADAPVLMVCVYMTSGLLVISFGVYTWKFIRTVRYMTNGEAYTHIDLSAGATHHPEAADEPGADAVDSDAAGSEERSPGSASSPAPTSQPEASHPS